MWPSCQTSIRLSRQSAYCLSGLCSCYRLCAARGRPRLYVMMLVSLSVGAHMASKQNVVPSWAPSSSFIKKQAAHRILDNCPSSWHRTAFQRHPFSITPPSSVLIQGHYPTGLAWDSTISLQPARTCTVNATLGSLSGFLQPPVTDSHIQQFCQTLAFKGVSWDTMSSIQLGQLAGEVWRLHMPL